MILLSLLIPSLNNRAGKLASLLRILSDQLEKNKAIDIVELVVDVDNGEATIGAKRNRMMQGAKGKYLASIDDDDRISDDYISLVLAGIKTKPDCCSLNGIYSEKGHIPQTFKHSIEYNGWYEKDKILYRFPNHLNCVKSSIAKKMKYPDITFAEDKSYSEQLQESGLLKVEYKIEPILYYYDYVRK